MRQLLLPPIRRLAALAAACIAVAAWGQDNASSADSRCSIEALDAQPTGSASPNLVGCRYTNIASYLARRFSNVRLQREASTEYPSGVITKQVNVEDDLLLTLSVGPGPRPLPVVTISGNPRVVEGGTLSFAVSRGDPAETPVSVKLDVQGAEWLDNPPASLTIDAGQSNVALDLHTVAGPTANGPRTVIVALRDIDGGRLGEVTSATGTIEDAPPPAQAPRLTITAPSSIGWGEALRIEVSRTPAADTNINIPYTIHQVTVTSAVDSAGELILPARRTALRQNVALNPCTTLVTITLSTPESTTAIDGSPQVTTNIDGEPPDYCRARTGPEELLDWFAGPHEWWEYVGSVLGAAVLGLLGWKLIRRNPDPIPDPDPIFEPDPIREPDSAPLSPPALLAHCEIADDGSATLEPREHPLIRLPDLHAEATIADGAASASTPLPVISVEYSDGR